MGEASFINVLGGAGCLSTGGIHWMDFALDILMNLL